jgi:hypothetical protein
MMFAMRMASISIRSRSRCICAGRFQVYFSGGVAGECAGAAYGRALNANPPGSRVAEPAAIATATLEGIDLEAVEDQATEEVSLSAELNGYTHSAVFTAEQVASGKAQLLIGSDGADFLITFDSSPTTPGSFEVTRSELLPDPAA